MRIKQTNKLPSLNLGTRRANLWLSLGAPGGKVWAPSPLCRSLRLAAIWPIETVLTKVIWQRRHLCPWRGKSLCGKADITCVGGSHALPNCAPTFWHHSHFRDQELSSWYEPGASNSQAGSHGSGIGLRIQWALRISGYSGRDPERETLGLFTSKCMRVHDRWFKSNHRTSLAVQWLRLYLPMQGGGFDPWSGAKILNTLVAKMNIK